MRKSFKYYLIIWAICFVLFNVFVFVIPSTIDGKTIAKVVALVSSLKVSNSEITGSILSTAGIDQVVFNKFAGAFWPGYITIVVSFIGQIVCSYFAFKQTNNTKFFYNIPIIKNSYIGLVVITIFGILCMFVPNVPIWAGVVVCLLVMVVTAISTVKAFAVSSIVSTKDDEIKERTEFMKEMTAKAKVLWEQDKENKDLKRLYEAFRYADPTISTYKTEIEKMFIDFEENKDVDIINKIIMYIK